MSKADDPPLRIKICWIVLIALLFPLMVAAPNYADYSSERWVVIEENSFLTQGVSIPEVRVMTSLVGGNYEYSHEVLLGKIIYCESGGNPNAKNPKSTAYGLCQFLDGTWDYVQDKWDVELDRDSPKDQLYACERLLEEEGLIHWEPVWECINYEE